MQMMIGTEKKTDHKPTITNLAFVANEYFGDNDDEQVDGCDALFDDFGGDSFYISSSSTLLGFGMGDDGCEPFEEETDEEAVERYLTDIENDIYEDYADYEHYDYLKGVKVRVAAAVRHALAIQNFFLRRKQAEKYRTQKARYESYLSVLALAKKPSLNEPEVEEVWRMSKITISYADGRSTVRGNENARRPVIGNRGGKTFCCDSKDVLILAEVVVNGKPFRVSRAA